MQNLLLLAPGVAAQGGHSGRYARRAVQLDRLPRHR
jgi:hypothetical protein